MWECPGTSSSEESAVVQSEDVGATAKRNEMPISETTFSMVVTRTTLHARLQGVVMKTRTAALQRADTQPSPTSLYPQQSALPIITTSVPRMMPSLRSGAEETIDLEFDADDFQPFRAP